MVASRQARTISRTTTRKPATHAVSTASAEAAKAGTRTCVNQLNDEPAGLGLSDAETAAARSKARAGGCNSLAVNVARATATAPTRRGRATIRTVVQSACAILGAATRERSLDETRAGNAKKRTGVTIATIVAPRTGRDARAGLEGGRRFAERPGECRHRLVAHGCVWARRSESRQAGAIFHCAVWFITGNQSRVSVTDLPSDCFPSDYW